MKTIKELWPESVTAVPNTNLSFSKWLEDCLIWTVKNWLEQNRADIGNQIYSDHPVVANAVFDVLLSNLESPVQIGKELNNV